MRAAVVYVAVAAGLVLATVILRGQAISEWNYLNPDEAELIFQARAARQSPVPFTTWTAGTTGPIWPLFLAGLNACGAPLTLAFAHLLAAVLLALTAAILWVVTSRAIGRGRALVVTLVWWLPIAVIFPVGSPVDFGALSTEYLPTLLIISSALIPREQLVVRPWLFSALGVLASFAVGAKFQVAPLAVAFAVAQLLILRPSPRRLVVSLLWWLAGAMLPAALIVLIMVAASVTNWSLVEQTLSFLTSYAGGPSAIQKVVRTLVATHGATGFLVVQLGVLVWLSRHSDKRSNLARVVLLLGGFASMLIGGMGFPHYLILLFGACGLAATMPVKAGTRLVPQRPPPKVLAGAIAVIAVLLLAHGYITDRWRPLSAGSALAAVSADSVARNPTMARDCPPGSRAMVWGWAPEIYIAQDWQSTTPYPNVLGMAISPTIRDGAEPMVREGIDRARCVVDATNLTRPQCPGARTERPLTYCLPPTVMLSRIYPKLFDLISRQFHSVPVTSGCDGCWFYVRDVSP